MYVSEDIFQSEARLLFEKEWVCSGITPDVRKHGMARDPRVRVGPVGSTPPKLLGLGPGALSLSHLPLFCGRESASFQDECLENDMIARR